MLQVVEHAAAEIADMARQTGRDQIERIARGDDDLHIPDGGERIRHGDQVRHLPPQLLVRLRGIERGAHPRGGERLERMHQRVRRVGLAARKRAGHVIAIGLGFGRHEIARDPRPDRIERRARDAARRLAVGLRVGEERFERLEECARRRADAWRIRVLAGVAHRGAHLLQQHVAAGDLVAAQHGALELRHEQCSCPGRKLSQELPQPIKRQGARGHAVHHALLDIRRRL